MTAVELIESATQAKLAGRAYAENGDLLSATMMMHSANISAQLAIAVELGEVKTLAITALDALLEASGTTPNLPPIPPRADLVGTLTDILREAYESHEFGPVWPVLAKAAIEFMED